MVTVSFMFSYTPINCFCCYKNILIKNNDNILWGFIKQNTAQKSYRLSAELKKAAVRNVSPSITPAMLHQFAHCSCKQRNALSWKGGAHMDFLV